MNIDNIHISILLSALAADTISTDRAELIAALAKESDAVAIARFRTTSINLFAREVKVL